MKDWQQRFALELGSRIGWLLGAVAFAAPLLVEGLYRLLSPLNFSLPPERYPEQLALALVHWVGLLLALVWPAHEVIRREASGERAWWSGQGWPVQWQWLAVWLRCNLVWTVGWGALLAWSGLHSPALDASLWGAALGQLAMTGAVSLLLTALCRRLSLVALAGLLWLAAAHLPAVFDGGIQWLRFLLPAFGRSDWTLLVYLPAYLLLAQAVAKRRFSTP